MDYCIAPCRRSRRFAFLGFVMLAIMLVALIPATASAAPTATITGGPAAGASTNAINITFTISALNIPVNDIDFYCSLDDAAVFEPCHAFDLPVCVHLASGQESCTQSKAYNSLPEGSHVFRVFASDCSSSCDNADKWTDGPIVSRSFIVDRQAPVVSVVSGPSMMAPLLTDSATFILAISESAQVSCVLDIGAVFPCSTAIELPVLANGIHYLRLTATDPAGNVSAPLTHSFEVDIFKPKKCRKGKSAKAKAKRKKCLKKNSRAKVKWKKKHGLR